VQGLIVTSLLETSDAYRNGLRNDDVVVAVDNEDVRTANPSTVFKNLRTFKSSPVTFCVKRLPTVEMPHGNVSDLDVTMVSDMHC